MQKKEEGNCIPAKLQNKRCNKITDIIIKKRDFWQDNKFKIKNNKPVTGLIIPVSSETKHTDVFSRVYSYKCLFYLVLKLSKSNRK